MLNNEQRAYIGADSIACLSIKPILSFTLCDDPNIIFINIIASVNIPIYIGLGQKKSRFQRHHSSYYCQGFSHWQTSI